MPRILLIDNIDSFTYNLEHYLVSSGSEVDVVTNDSVEFNSLESYDGIVLSPGPGLPEDAGSMMEVLNEVSGKVPVLGVCLGMQGMAIHLGDGIFNQESVKHGVKCVVSHGSSGLLRGIESEFEAGLYHSWAIQGEGEFDVTARSSEGIVMAIENKELAWYGVQFHPESIMTPSGMKIIENFLTIIEERSRAKAF